MNVNMNVLCKVPNAELIKDLKWINPQGEEVSQDSRYQTFYFIQC